MDGFKSTKCGGEKGCEKFGFTYHCYSCNHVDEFVVGGKEDAKQGRNYDTKKTKTVIALELTDKNKMKRVYVKAIDEYLAASFTPIFKEHISSSTKIFTDKWRGYSTLKENIILNREKVNIDYALTNGI